MKTQCISLNRSIDTLNEILASTDLQAELRFTLEDVLEEMLANQQLWDAMQYYAELDEREEALNIALTRTDITDAEFCQIEVNL